MATLEQRYHNILRSYGHGQRKKDIVGRKNQEEFAHLINQIERYGFNFHPEVYVEPLIIQLEKLANNKSN